MFMDKLILIKDPKIAEALQKILGPKWIVVVSNSGEKAVEVYSL